MMLFHPRLVVIVCGAAFRRELAASTLLLIPVPPLRRLTFGRRPDGRRSCPIEWCNCHCSGSWVCGGL